MDDPAADDKNSFTGDNIKDDAMTDSCVTTNSSSDGGNYSDDEQGADGFWPLVASDLRALYSSVSTTAGGAVRFLQNSALSVAAEIAELERHQEGVVGGGGVDSDQKLLLPWELEDATVDDAATAAANSITMEDEELKAEIMLLSHKASHFLEPFTVADDFLLDEGRIALIRELLEIDPVLAKTHARLSSRTSTTEALFWRNYFYHCQVTRDKHLFSELGQQQKKQLDDNKDGASILSGEDSSYVCIDGSISRPPSAPSSLNMLSRSTEDLVILGNPDNIPKSPTSPTSLSGGKAEPRY